MSWKKKKKQDNLFLTLLWEIQKESSHCDSNQGVGLRHERRDCSNKSYK